MCKTANGVVVDTTSIVSTRLVFGSWVAVESGSTLRSAGETSAWGSFGGTDCGFTARSSCVGSIVIIVVLADDGVLYFVEESSHVE